MVSGRAYPGLITPTGTRDSLSVDSRVGKWRIKIDVSYSSRISQVHGRIGDDHRLFEYVHSALKHPRDTVKFRG